MAYAVGRDEFEGWSFTELRAKRAKALDGFYDGRKMLDWSDEVDRGHMVQYADFYCSYEYDPSPEECAECFGKHYCSRYEREHEGDDAV